MAQYLILWKGLDAVIKGVFRGIED